jgi:hypothetical protein
MNTNMDRSPFKPVHRGNRRALLKSAAGIATLGVIGAPLLGVPKLSDAAALIKDMRDKLTPDQIIDDEAGQRALPRRQDAAMC